MGRVELSSDQQTVRAVWSPNSAPAGHARASYALMTAAHNEEGFIEKTITSVLGQTLRPKRWIIISDGSTDKTDEIVERYASQHEWIHFLKLNRPPGRNFGSKGLALKRGAELLAGAAFEYVGNLDADIVVEPRYFEGLLSHFNGDPRLGIAAGFVYEEQGGEFRNRSANRRDSVPHGAQLVRRECYEEIGGYAVLKHGGEDWYAQQCAKMQGWHAQAWPELKIFHNRHTGSASSSLHHHFRAGLSDYSLGSDPFFELVKCAVRVSEKPRLLGAVTRLLGFLYAALRREKRQVSREFIEFLRREQRAKLRDVFRGTARERLARV